jgi:hypothetical protein
VIERAHRFGTAFIPIDTVIADSTEYLAAELQASSYYAFRVKALNLGFESEYSNVFSLVTDPVSVNNMVADDNNSLNVFPNPFAESCFISLKDSYVGQVEVCVISMGGKRILESDFFKSQEMFNQQMDLSELPFGIYMIEVRYENSSLVKAVYKFR